MSRRMQRQRRVRAASILLATIVATAGCRDLSDGLSVSRQGAMQRSIDESRRTAIVNAVEVAASAVVSVNATVRQRIVPRSRFDALFLPGGASSCTFCVLPPAVTSTSSSLRCDSVPEGNSGMLSPVRAASVVIATDATLVRGRGRG